MQAFSLCCDRVRGRFGREREVCAAKPAEFSPRRHRARLKKRIVGYCSVVSLAIGGAAWFKSWDVGAGRCASRTCAANASSGEGLVSGENGILQIEQRHAL